MLKNPGAVTSVVINVCQKTITIKVEYNQSESKPMNKQFQTHCYKIIEKKQSVIHEREKSAKQKGEEESESKQI